MRHTLPIPAPRYGTNDLVYDITSRPRHGRIYRNCQEVRNLMHVQFCKDKKEIMSVFDCPQDPKVYADLGEVENDPRYIEFIDETKSIV